MSSRTAYLDDSERPRLRQSVTAFLDVLGFSQAVVSAEQAGQSQQCLDKIVQALNGARAYVRESMANDEFVSSRQWGIKFFSDNLVFGCPCDEATKANAAVVFVLRCTQHYQLQMALSGFFVRGGLTLGPLCITDDIIFGAALIESYQLEAKTSIVPRVVLTEPVLKMALAHFQREQEQALPEHKDLLCRDIDGWWFVNYLQSAVGPTGVDWQRIEQHKKSVMASLPRSPRHDILPKFGWVSRYHNVFCHWHRDAPGYSDDFRIRRVDEESSIGRLSDVSFL